MLPATIRDVDHLDDLLSEPTPLVIDTLARLEGDLLILGVGGKMGPTLARMARRASDAAGRPRRILAAARFSTAGLQAWLETHGVETIRCDLLEAGALDRLPEIGNVIFMTGRKFGSTGQESLTWAMNALLPGWVGQRFRHSRIVAFSTGNVYGLTPTFQGGSCETDTLSPVGEYAMSCLGRERILEHMSRTFGTPMALIRLNYACEMRYGVLMDVAQRVKGGLPVELGMGSFNAIWQGDANAIALAALAHVHSPPFVVNVAGPETLGVRRVAEEFARLLGVQPRWSGQEGALALLSNAQLAVQRFGYPRVGIRDLMLWTADWLRRGMPTWDKPTHFESLDGRF